VTDNSTAQARDKAAKTLATGVCPIDLATIKDDLGVPAGDSSSDAFLQRRMDAAWSRFQEITGRELQLVAGYADDWGAIPHHHRHPYTPYPFPYSSAFLRNYPVASITKITTNGANGDPASVLFVAETGKLVSLSGPGFASDLGGTLISMQARIEYQAGFDVIPADLYDALLGVVTVHWQQRQTSQSGLTAGGFNASRISITDVGQVDLDPSPNWLADQSSRAGKVPDPLVGIYGSVLDTYTDYRTLIGGPSSYAATTKIPAPPP
jgi:hypothetical protein